MQPKRRLPVGVLVIIPIIAGFALYAFTGQRVVQPEATLTPKPSPTELARPYTVAEPTPVSPPSDELPLSPPSAFPQPPTYTPPPTSHGPFHGGAWVRVNAGAGDCLNARLMPSLTLPGNTVETCVPDGYEGVIADYGYATEQDGHWWWRLAGTGWVAEDYLTYLHEADLENETRTRFGGWGRIAYTSNDGELSIMESDGTGRRVVVPASDDKIGVSRPQDVTWSPDGERLSYNIGRWDNSGASIEYHGEVDLHILDLASGTEIIVPDVAGRGWSPDGARIGIVRGATPQQMGGGWYGEPGWVDAPTGEISLLSDAKFWQQDPPAWNFDGSLLLITRNDADPQGGGQIENTRPRIIVQDLAGNQIASLVMGEGDWFGSPHWSPVANQFAFHMQTREGDAAGTYKYSTRYAVFDVTANAVIATAELPQPNPNAGGKCGGGDMYRTGWSADGKTVYYSADSAVGGSNGIWAWDVASGSQPVIHATGAGIPIGGPGSLVIFSADGVIFLGDAATGNKEIVGGGYALAWAQD